MTTSKKDFLFWQNKWETTQRWNLEVPHPLLPHTLKIWEDLKQSNRENEIYVPGCGHGHDAYYLANQRFKVTAEDIIPRAVEKAKETYRHPGLSFRLGDSLSCPISQKGKYNLVFDRAVLCAVSPHLRENYLRSTHCRLKSQGWFMLIGFTKLSAESTDIPPFSLKKQAMVKLLEKFFTVHHYEERSDGGVGKLILEESIILAQRKQSQ